MSSSGNKEDGVDLFNMAPPEKTPKKSKSPIVLVTQLVYLTLMFVPYILRSVLKYFFFTEMKNITGQIVLVTGAAKGLGRGLALGFAKEGCKVICVDIDAESNEKTASLINNLYPNCAKAYKVNVAKPEEIRSMAKEVERDFDHVDILVNNAGLVFGSPILEGEDYQYEAFFKVNALSHYYMVRTFLPSMLERNKGHIVAISSASAFIGIKYLTAYAGTKWAINGFMESLHEELRLIPGIQVKTTTICPYFINTNPLYTKHWNIRMPELSIEETVNTTIEAVKRNDRILTIPRGLYWALIIQKLLPDSLLNLAKNVFYVKILKADEDTKKNSPTATIIDETVSKSTSL